MVIVTALGSGLGAAQSYTGEWSPAVGEALALYRSDEFERAAVLARAIETSTTDRDARADAQAVQALIGLRSEDRSARLNSRTALLQLDAGRPGIADRAESQYALGVAATALGETTLALEQLERAAARLAGQKRWPEAADVLVAIAKAWAGHGEWEITPRTLIEERPRNPEEAHDLRLAKVLGTRNRVEELGSFPEQHDDIDLVVGRMQLDRPASLAAGVEVLSQLAGRTPLHSVGAQAAMVLGRSAVNGGRVHEARRWWTLASGGPDMQVQRDARAALDRLPATEVELHAESRGKHVQIEASAQDSTELTIEVRALDLSQWVANRQGRVVETMLPEDGAVLHSETIPAELEQAGAEESGPNRFIHQIEVEAGAYVIMARLPAKGSSGAPGSHSQVAPSQTVAKLLLVHQPAPAFAVVGSARVAVCVAGTGQSGGAVEFWMQGGFSPKRVELNDGAATFELPPEAAVLVARRWTMLVRAGERIALLEGTLPGSAAGAGPSGLGASPTGSSRAAPASAVLLAGPAGVGAGQDAYVAGVLCDGQFRAARGTNDPITVELHDAGGEVIASCSVEAPDGLVCARLALGGELAPDSLHVIARQGQRVIPLAGGRVGLSTSLATLALDVELQADRTPAAAAMQWTPAWTVRWPWGAAVADETFTAGLRPYTLPAARSPFPQVLGGFSDHGHLDARGHGSIEFPLQAVDEAEEQMLFLSFAVTVEGSAQALHHERVLRRGDAGPTHPGLPAGRELVPAGARAPVATEGTDAMACDAHSVAWLIPLTEQMQVGEPVSFWAGWVDVRAQAMGAAPVVRVRADGRDVAQLSLLWGAGGWRSQEWRPEQAGSYAAMLEVQRVSAPPLQAQYAFEVSIPKPPAAEAGVSPGPRISATLVEHGGRRRVETIIDVPPNEAGEVGGYFVCLTDEEPGTIAAIPRPGGERTSFVMPWERATAPRQALLIRCTNEGAGVVAAAPIAQNANANQALRLEGPPQVVGGGTAEICYAWERAAGGTGRVLLCLTRAADSGFQAMGTDTELRADAAEPTLACASSIDRRSKPGSSELGGAGGVGGARSRSLERLVRPREDLVWAGIEELAGTSGVLSVPIPAQGRFFRLRAVAVKAGDAQGEPALLSDVLLDAGDALQIALDFPAFCSVGDRPWATAVIRNTSAVEKTCKVELSGSNGLTVEGVVGGDAGIQPERIVSLTIAAGGVRRVCWATEVAGEGAGQIQTVVQTDGDAQTVQRRFEIAAAPQAGGRAVETGNTGANKGAQVRIGRSLFLMQEEARDPAEIGQEQTRSWSLQALAGDVTLKSGQLVLVREEIELAQAIRGLTWRQRLPGTALGKTLPDGQKDWVQIAQLRRSTFAAYEFAAPALGAGVHRHHYCLRAGRPGVCYLPPPEVLSGNQSVPVEMREEVRIQVLSPGVGSEQGGGHRHGGT